MPQVTILYFASLQDIMGCRQEIIEISPDWTVAELLDHLEGRQPELGPLRGGYRVAVDLEMRNETDSIGNAREIGLIPPVSGGSGAPVVRLGEEPIDSQLLLEQVQRPDCGAVVLFLGTVRDSHQGNPVSHIDYSAYQALAAKQLEELAARAQAQLAIGSVAVWHRYGRVAAGEASVGVAVSTPHRVQAFETGQWLIDTLKAEVSLWKREVGPDGAVWLEGDARINATS